ncbi:hypothetical protein BRUM_0820 [Bifidobacterium ruminantium]|uniref:Uncharacterized protein n=1 Tax=Bifidobacterium ruminantium TaxID=78346 RepID=A0A087D260_BIFRU|nr:hypothetical protein BRUM_0820 [Bifidobacterium ruminantium]
MLKPALIRHRIVKDIRIGNEESISMTKIIFFLSMQSWIRYANFPQLTLFPSGGN